MKFKITPNYLNLSTHLESTISGFETLDNYDYEKRNKMRSIMINDLNINVKSFKIPNIINRLVYKFFRKSKAKRSFIYADVILKKGILTPQPIAYYEFFSSFGINNSYYISEHISYDIMYRTLVSTPDYPDHEKILRAFTQFTWRMHEQGILFKDHSPGNTLIKKNGDYYDFYLVDLNRMRFFDLDFETRIKNFARLTPKKEMVAVMSEEYAKLINEPYEKVFHLMWKETKAFQNHFFRKKRWKKRLLGKPIVVD